MGLLEHGLLDRMTGQQILYLHGRSDAGQGPGMNCQLVERRIRYRHGSRNLMQHDILGFKKGRLGAKQAKDLLTRPNYGADHAIPGHFHLPFQSHRRAVDRAPLLSKRNPADSSRRGSVSFHVDSQFEHPDISPRNKQLRPAHAKKPEAQFIR